MRIRSINTKWIWLANTVLLCIGLYLFFVRDVLDHPMVTETYHAVSMRIEDESETVQTTASQKDREIILNSQLFGSVNRQKHSEPQDTVAQQLKTSSAGSPALLDIRLMGTVAGDPAVSYAVVEDLKEQRQRLLRIGDTIRTARVEAILANQIVVQQNGQQYVLEVSLTDGTINDTPHTQSADNIGESKGKSGELSDFIRSVSEDEKLVNRAATGRAIQEIYRTLSNITLSPVQMDDGRRGLKVSDIDRTPLSMLVGLRDGDIIHSINGQSVRDLRKAIQVMKKAKHLNESQVGLWRDEEEKTISLQKAVW